MCGNIVTEGQKSELSVGRLVQRPRSDACAILIDAQPLTIRQSGAHLRMPYVKDTRISGSDYLDVGTDVFAIEHDVFATPADYLLIEATDFQEVGTNRKLKNDTVG